ncbi:AraC family transcriptional regulator [Pseudonocardia sp. GCM10023141]|uniref:AraC family transcriptional regulator n=1 Tax=Pseudonocardia sp. GCM10023141 TaxID=3252653 RepID=UPI00360679CA
MERSSGQRHNPQGVPVLDYVRTAGLPAISVRRWAAGHGRAPVQGTHAHDFLVLLYVERGDDVLHVDGRDWALTAGDAFVIAPGAVVTDDTRPESADRVIWAVVFPADTVDPSAAGSLVSWQAHPLLAPFADQHRGGGQRLPVPPEDRPTWLAHLADLDTELRGRQDGYVEAARSHLTLLLVRLSRLRIDEPGGLDVEPLIAAVFTAIENRYHEQISLRDVAAAVGLTPGHVTTVVRQRTGRTVQQWITERRLREARRLLADTDLTIAEVGHRVGYDDAGYFGRRFRTAHGVAAAAWRRAGTAMA